ncbi:hypothetical protein EDD91_0050 [Streptomyces sp. KS 21]|nr:hypothetical protein EDD91_0050 [Streptomyces sp. KS 21]
MAHRLALANVDCRACSPHTWLGPAAPTAPRPGVRLPWRHGAAGSRVRTRIRAARRLRVKAVPRRRPDVTPRCSLPAWSNTGTGEWEWIESGGGPLIVVPEQVLTSWQVCDLDADPEFSPGRLFVPQSVAVGNGDRGRLLVTCAGRAEWSRAPSAALRAGLRPPWTARPAPGPGWLSAGPSAVAPDRRSTSRRWGTWVSRSVPPPSAGWGFSRLWSTFRDDHFRSTRVPGAADPSALHWWGPSAGFGNWSGRRLKTSWSRRWTSSGTLCWSRPAADGRT